jgi:hypothetical protein
MNEITNDYAAAFGDMFREIPKEVFAAVAVSLGMRAAGTYGSMPRGMAHFFAEWAWLHSEGVVIQAPPFKEGK